MVKEPRLADYLSIGGWRIGGFIPSLGLLVVSERQRVSIRIWIRVAESISYWNSLYVTSASITWLQNDNFVYFALSLFPIGRQIFLSMLIIISNKGGVILRDLRDLHTPKKEVTITFSTWIQQTLPIQNDPKGCLSIRHLQHLDKRGSVWEKNQSDQGYFVYFKIPIKILIGNLLDFTFVGFYS